MMFPQGFDWNRDVMSSVLAAIARSHRVPSRDQLGKCYDIRRTDARLQGDR